MSNSIKRIFLTGSGGQVGSTLVKELRSIYGANNVMVTDQYASVENDIHALDVII